VRPAAGHLCRRDRHRADPAVRPAPTRPSRHGHATGGVRGRTPPSVAAALRCAAARPRPQPRGVEWRAVQYTVVWYGMSV